jgi:nitrate/nitrite transporter NarK
MIGTAYGLSGVFLNFGRVIFPPMVGYIQENTVKNHGYFWTEISFMLVSTVALCIEVFIYLSVKKEKQLEMVSGS